MSMRAKGEDTPPKKKKSAVRNRILQYYSASGIEGWCGLSREYAKHFNHPKTTTKLHIHQQQNSQQPKPHQSVKFVQICNEDAQRSRERSFTTGPSYERCMQLYTYVGGALPLPHSTTPPIVNCES